MTASEERVFEVAAERFALLAAPSRLRIVCTLLEGEKNVTQLLRHVAMSQPNMSQNLQALYRGGVLARRREGAQVYYRLDNEQVRDVCAALVCPSSPPDSHLAHLQEPM